MKRFNPEIPANWHIVKVDERDYWRDDLRDKTSAIFTVYAFDKASHTHLCEATPSYALWWIGYEAEPIDGLSDEERESLYEQVECGMHPDQACDYMHARDVDSLCARHPERVKRVSVDEEAQQEDDQVAVDEIMDGWNTGAIRF